MSAVFYVRERAEIRLWESHSVCNKHFQQCWTSISEGNALCFMCMMFLLVVVAAVLLQLPHSLITLLFLAFSIEYINASST